MKNLVIICFFAVFLGCSTGTGSNPDFSLSYNSKNVLMDWELNISVNGEILKLDYKNKQGGKSGNWNYTITESESKKIHSYLKSSGFLTMKQPEGEQVVDMPQQNLTGTSGSKTNYIEFGTVKEIPEAISTMKQMLFDLATKYKPSWKTEAGLE